MLILYLYIFLAPCLYIVRSCNHYALFVIIAQILQDLAFPLFTAIINTKNLCKLRSTLENAKCNPRNDMRIGVNSRFCAEQLEYEKAIITHVVCKS